MRYPGVIVSGICGFSKRRFLPDHRATAEKKYEKTLLIFQEYCDIKIIVIIIAKEESLCRSGAHQQELWLLPVTPRWTNMYAEMARTKTAEEEGFLALAAQFEGVGKIEKLHEERYLKLLDNLKRGEVFHKNGKVMWFCRNCGHVEVAENAPAVCPVCKHPQAYFQIKAQNY